MVKGWSLPFYCGDEDDDEESGPRVQRIYIVMHSRTQRSVHQSIRFSIIPPSRLRLVWRSEELGYLFQPVHQHLPQGVTSVYLR